MQAIHSGAADAIEIKNGHDNSLLAIQDAEKVFKTMVETMNEGTLITATDGFVLYVNKKMCTLLGMQYPVVVGQNIRNLVIENQKDDFDIFLKMVARNGPCHKDFEFVRQNNTVVLVYLSCTPLEISGRHDICIVVSDLTERKLVQSKLIELNSSLEQKILERTRELKQLTETLEEQVSHRTSQVRELAKALSLAEQRQRQYLSLVLHEDLQQALFATKTRTSLLKNSLTKEPKEVLLQDLAEIEKLLAHSIDTTRQLAIEFNPPVLHNEGIDAALQWLIYHIHQRYGLKVHLEIREGFTIFPEDERVLIVNLTRELLLNVIKHAGVSSASLCVYRRENHIVVEVEDKGVGFDFEMERAIAQERNHLGLFSIKERLCLFGGTLTIESQVGHGTKMIMTLPFDPNQKKLSVE